MHSQSMRLFRGVLSAFIVFHLFSVLLVPNAQNRLGAAAARFVEPYVNFFELTNAWSFFAPEPGPPPVYLEYELTDRQGAALTTGRWPEVNSPYWFRDRQNRRVAAAEYMMASDVRADRMMLHYLCTQYPEAGAAHLWRVMYTIPSPEEVAEGKRTIGDEIRMERKLVSHSFCEEKS